MSSFKELVLQAKGFVAQMSNTMILLYLVFIKILLNSLKTSILQNIYATKPVAIRKER